MHSLRRLLEDLSREWIHSGLPSREQVIQAAQTIIRNKQHHSLPGLWPVRPRIITATLDDGIGQGIEIIELFSDALGLEVISLGLMQKPDAILSACHLHAPRYVGLTVLQLDTEDDLMHIGRHLPPSIRLVAGGPAFRYDPDLAARCGVHATPVNVAHFIAFMLSEA